MLANDHKKLIKNRFEFSNQKKYLLGHGAFSRVYKGIDLITKKKVAIKCIDCVDFKKSTLNKLSKEIEICKNLHHPNIVNTLDVYKDTDCDYIYIIMECCAFDLNHYLTKIRKNTPISEERAKNYFKQLAEAFKYLRDRNIVHRDLKPHNLLLTENARYIKIADFGFARSLHRNDLAQTLCGSPLYMAPEVLSKNDYTIKADIWSLGVILFEILFGYHPYHEAKNTFDLMRLLEEKDIKLRIKRSKFSDDCKNLLLGFICKNVQYRSNWIDYFSHPWICEIVIIDYQNENCILETNINGNKRSQPIAIQNKNQTRKELNREFIIEDYWAIKQNNIEVSSSFVSMPNITSVLGEEGQQHLLMRDSPSSWKDNVKTYMITSFDLLRDSYKYLNSI